MIRRSASCMLSRMLLSTLLPIILVLSQQMAMAHALSHWTSQLVGPIAQQTPNDSELSSAFAQDRSCAQCLGLAQLATPLATTPRQFLPPDLGESTAVDTTVRAWRLRQVRAFDSRAPPAPG